MFFKQIPAGGGRGSNGKLFSVNCFPDGSEINVLVLLRFNKFEFSRGKGGSTLPDTCNSCIELFFQNINTQVDRTRGSEPHKFAFITDIKRIIFYFRNVIGLFYYINQY